VRPLRQITAELDAARQERARLAGELTDIDTRAGSAPLTGGLRVRWDNLSKHADRLMATIDALEKERDEALLAQRERSDMLRRSIEDGTVVTESGDGARGFQENLDRFYVSRGGSTVEEDLAAARAAGGTETVEYSLPLTTEWKAINAFIRLSVCVEVYGTAASLLLGGLANADPSADISTILSIAAGIAGAAGEAGISGGC